MPAAAETAPTAVPVGMADVNVMRLLVWPRLQVVPDMCAAYEVHAARAIC